MVCWCTLLLTIPVGILIIFVFAGIHYRRNAGRCRSTKQMTGKTVIITGANTGIGFSAARDLASRGARVILACRNKEKANAARETIVRTTKNENVVVRLVDVSDMNSVRAFCKEILATETRLDVLINNAGAGFPDRRESAQGHELTIATNHYGCFLMTLLLLGLLEKSTLSRIVTVSSGAHKRYALDFEDIHFKRREYGTFTAYCQSKLCNILFTKELSHRLTGKGVTANCLHPGVVGTDITDHEGRLLGKLLKLLLRIVGKDSDLGAQTTIYLAVADEVAKISGEYFSDCKIAECSKKALDPGLAKKLWELTEDEVGLSTEEKAII